MAFAAQGSISFLAAFFSPASQAAMPNLVDPEDLPTATAVMSSTWGSMLAVGAALGGLFTVAFGRRASFIADAVSFAIAAVLIAGIRRRTNLPREEHHARRMRPVADTAEALHYARKNGTVAALLMSKMGFGLGGAMAGLLPIIATRTFHAGDSGIGLILLACGVAAISYGVVYTGVSLAPLLVLAAFGVLVAHLGGGAQWTLSTYGLQVSVPDALRGRIMAADFALVTFSLTVSYLVSGVASSHFGPRPVMRVLALVAVGWGAAYLVLTRRLRAAGRIPEITETTEAGTDSPGPDRVDRSQPEGSQAVGSE